MPEIERSWHVPVRAPDAFTQSPLQHWLLTSHTSLSWRQNDDAALHVPLVHKAEQHWLLLVQALPDSRHVPPLTLWHVPAHLPLQHCALLEHATPSLVHAVA